MEPSKCFEDILKQVIYDKTWSDVLVINAEPLRLLYSYYCNRHVLNLVSFEPRMYSIANAVLNYPHFYKLLNVVQKEHKYLQIRFKTRIGAQSV